MKGEGRGLNAGRKYSFGKTNKTHNQTGKLLEFKKISSLNISSLSLSLTFLLTHSIQQSASWEANTFSASQQIPRILWNPKVLYRIYNSQTPVPILSHINPVHAPPSHFLEIGLNIILLSMPGSSYWPLSIKTLYKSLLSPILATCPAHLILLYLIIRTVLEDEYRSLSSSLCSFLHSPVTSSPLGTNTSHYFNSKITQISQDHEYK